MTHWTAFMVLRLTMQTTWFSLCICIVNSRGSILVYLRFSEWYWYGYVNLLVSSTIWRPGLALAAVVLPWGHPYFKPTGLFSIHTVQQLRAVPPAAFSSPERGHLSHASFSAGSFGRRALSALVFIRTNIPPLKACQREVPPSCCSFRDCTWLNPSPHIPR
ncbi:hypothetical protein EDB89DRAFT_216377 [Lactarius sanguifluus]|nr:hypothetical protein EDB89DRAFT_216377 [Lactarius sanguifluus]